MVVKSSQGSAYAVAIQFICWSILILFPVQGKSEQSRFQGTEGVPVMVKHRIQSKQRPFQICRKYWDFDGDGTVDSTRHRPRITFPDNGNYRVQLRILCRPKSKRWVRVKSINSTKIKTVRVRNTPPAVRLNGPYSGTAGNPVYLKASPSDKGEIDSYTGFTYTWKFGDKTEAVRGANLQEVTHTYSKPGKYRARLIIEDKDGGISRSSFTRVVIEKANNAVPVPVPPSDPGADQPEAEPTPLPTIPPGVPVRTVKPEEDPAVFGNPGMGWQANNRIEHDGDDLNGFPIHVAYFKYYWDELHKGPGNINFSKMDQDLYYAGLAGQKVAFRFMISDDIRSGPTWLKNLGVHGYNYQYTGDGSQVNKPWIWTPDLDDPTVQKHLFFFIEELGKRYNGDSRLDSFDYSFVGLWGEGHFGKADVAPDIPLPSLNTRKKIIDAQVSAFPEIPVVAQLTDADLLPHTSSRGAGIRGDCLGNTWQTWKLYPDNIAASASTAWKNGPVIFESCWVMETWLKKGFDVEAILDWALQNHISAFNNKNNAVPSSLRGVVEKFRKRMGYRYTIRELTHPEYTGRGESMLISIHGENIGVAPSYGNHLLAFQFTNKNGQVAYFPITTHQAKNWLPGIFQVDSGVTIPTTMEPGVYTLSIGLIDPHTLEPPIRLANKGGKNNWYPFSSVEIR